jgi:hypothetical protein
MQDYVCQIIYKTSRLNPKLKPTVKTSRLNPKLKPTVKTSILKPAD